MNRPSTRAGVGNKPAWVQLSRLLGGLLVLAAIAGCSSSPTNTPAPASPEVEAVFVTTDIAVGSNLVVFGLIDRDGMPVRASEAQVRINVWLYIAAVAVYYLSFLFRGYRWRVLALNATDGAGAEADDAVAIALWPPHNSRLVRQFGVARHKKTRMYDGSLADWSRDAANPMEQKFKLQ